MAKQTPAPLPVKPDTGDVIPVNRTTLYYALTALLFFIAGYIVAFGMFSATTGSLVSDVSAAVGTSAAKAVALQLTQMPQPRAIAAQPTPTLFATPGKQAIDITNAPFWGPADAKVTVVEFGDFECPYCEYYYKMTYPLIKQNYATKIRYVFRDWPSPAHPNAFPAALAGQCANDQGKFWQYHDMLYEHQSNLSSESLINYADQLGLNKTQFTDCYAKQKFYNMISDDFNLGVHYHIRGTPTFFINGEFYEGVQAYEYMSRAIDQSLQAAAATS